jgi:hypothetical protein
MADKDHIILLEPPAIARDLRADCLNCGETMQLALPMVMDTFSRLLKTFNTRHQCCQRPAHIVEQAPGVLACQRCGLTYVTTQHAGIAPFVATHKRCTEAL